MTDTPKPTLSDEERADLKAKSLGEKLCDAIHLPLMYTSRAPWVTLGLDSRGSYEVAALAFAASLTHDETASAVIAALTARAEKAEAERDEAREISRTFAAHYKTGVNLERDEVLTRALLAVQSPEARAPRIKVLEDALRKIAQGNLGDRAWEANYDAIRQVAQDALSVTEGAK